jgi:hypothetical protein
MVQTVDSYAAGFRSQVLRSLELRQDDFDIEPEITGQACKRELRIYELVADRLVR